VSDVSYRRAMVELAISSEWKTGALLGLGPGMLMEMLLESQPSLNLIGVDHFVRADRKMRAMRIASRFPGRCLIHCTTTAKAAELINDATLDFVYIDAGHKYGCVRSDLRLWWPKVRIGGWFGGHDFHADYPGVITAVSERFGNDVRVDEHTIWSVAREK